MRTVRRVRRGCEEGGGRWRERCEGMRRVEAHLEHILAGALGHTYDTVPLASEEAVDVGEQAAWALTRREGHIIVDQSDEEGRKVMRMERVRASMQRVRACVHAVRSCELYAHMPGAGGEALRLQQAYL
jgi:hypothetical protein